MKLSAQISCFHEELFLDYSIESIYDYVDEIFLVDQALQSALDAGFEPHSTDNTQNIIDKWVDNKKIFYVEHKSTPKDFKELLLPGYELAKDRGAEWFLNCGADEIWSKESAQFIKPFLNICDKRNILALNVSMNIFGPDMWHCKDFRNPRLSKITVDSTLGRDGDAVIYPSLGFYQTAGNCEELYPPGTPDHIKKINGDFPKNLRPFHYSCVGKSRVDFKVKFWKQMNGTFGDRYNKAYVEQDWKKFEEFGYKPFTGKHPPIMEKHPLFNERLC